MAALVALRGPALWLAWAATALILSGAKLYLDGSALVATYPASAGLLASQASVAHFCFPRRMWKCCDAFDALQRLPTGCANTSSAL